MPQSVPDAKTHHGEASMDQAQSGEHAPAQAVAAEFPSPEGVPSDRRNIAAELCSGILGLAALLVAAALITLFVLPLAREIRADAVRGFPRSWCHPPR